MTALNRRHFQQRQSASLRSTLLEAAAEVGLDVTAAAAFLDTDELESEVWGWYRRTIDEKGIHSIPLFVFNVGAVGAVGGPFRLRGAADPYIARGSMDDDYFLDLFEVVLRDLGAGARVMDARAARFGALFDDRIAAGTSDDGGSCSV